MSREFLEWIRLNRIKNECIALLEKNNISRPYFTLEYGDCKSWGKCDHDSHQIILSDKLVQFKDFVIKSVIIHEVLHLVVGNNYHSGKWKELAEVINKNRGSVFVCSKYFTEDLLSEINMAQK